VVLEKCPGVVDSNVTKDKYLGHKEVSLCVSTGLVTFLFRQARTDPEVIVLTLKRTELSDFLLVIVLATTAWRNDRIQQLICWHCGVVKCGAIDGGSAED
jgi:hypothetical protein